MATKEIKNLDLTTDKNAKGDCIVDDNSTPEEISECIARTRRDLDDTLNVVEKKMDPSRLHPAKLYEQSVGYVRKNYQSEWQWFSDIPRRINENPESFIIIGAGMMIGGLGLASFALSKQRKSASHLSDSAGKKWVEKGKQKWREMRSHSDVKQRKREAQLRPAPETFVGVQSNQASTEEIFYDQTDRFNQDETSQSDVKSAQKTSHGSEGESKSFKSRGRYPTR